MQKYAAVLCVLIFGLLIGGCGGGSSASPTTVYGVPAKFAAPPTSTPTPMGGAVLGGAITGKFSNYSVSTRAGIAGKAGFTNTSSTTVATFNHPTDITTDGTDFYITDELNNSIRKMDPAGVVTTLACTDAVTGAAVLFNRPTGITVDKINIYVVDSGSNTIRIIEKTSNKVTIIGSTAGIAGAVDSAVPADARFNQPTGITTDGFSLFITDSGSHAIRWIDIETKKVSTLAGAPGTAGSVGGPPRDARFNLPARITTDGTNLYVTDYTSRTISKIVISSGVVSTIAGNAGAAPGTTDANASGADARFYNPNGITTDGTSLYVTDSYNNTIRKISLESPYNVEKIAGVTFDSSKFGLPSHVDSADGIPSFDTPVGITTDGTSLFVADSQNHTIRKIH
jgi:hypothetical protein